WTYFGYSKGYNIFVGIVEMLAGFLLFRKTFILGALITMSVSINIMLANYFFDVPVKLLSTSLFILSLFLILPNLKPLFNFIVLGKSAQLKGIGKRRFAKRWQSKMAFVVKIVVLATFVGQQIFIYFSRQNPISQHWKKSPLYGIYL